MLCCVGIDIKGVRDIEREFDACKIRGDSVVSVRFYARDSAQRERFKETHLLSLAEALGMEVTGKAGEVAVRSVSVGGQAARSGIQVGSILFFVGGACRMCL